jgi:hypothetical protein
MFVMREANHGDLPPKATLSEYALDHLSRLAGGGDRHRTPGDWATPGQHKVRKQPQTAVAV